MKRRWVGVLVLAIAVWFSQGVMQARFVITTLRRDVLVSVDLRRPFIMKVLPAIVVPFPQEGVNMKSAIRAQQQLRALNVITLVQQHTTLTLVS